MNNTITKLETRMEMGIMKDWIDRLYAVGQKLPRSQREDIKKELRSIILDDLDERIANQKLQEITKLGRCICHIRVLRVSDEVLQYRPNNRYLIGPELYELYCLLFHIVWEQ